MRGSKSNCEQDSHKKMSAVLVTNKLAHDRLQRSGGVKVGETHANAEELGEALIEIARRDRLGVKMESKTCAGEQRVKL